MRKPAAIALMLLLAEIAGAQIPNSGQRLFRVLLLQLEPHRGPNQPERVGRIN
jgi:hypothetical protein